MESSTTSTTTTLTRKPTSEYRQTKRFKRTEAGNVFAFLPVHLRVLEALYPTRAAAETSTTTLHPNRTNNSPNGNDEGTAVPSSTWAVIREFLEQRAHLMQSQQSANQCRHIEERARQYMEQRTPRNSITSESASSALFFATPLKSMPILSSSISSTTRSGSGSSFSLILTKLLQERTQRVQQDLQNHSIIPALTQLQQDIQERIAVLEKAVANLNSSASTTTAAAAALLSKTRKDAATMAEEENDEDTPTDADDKDDDSLVITDPIATVNELLTHAAPPDDSLKEEAHSRRQTLEWKMYLWKLLYSDVQTILGDNSNINNSDHDEDSSN